VDDVDIIIEDNLTVFMLKPVTPAAQTWLAFNAPPDSIWWTDRISIDAERLPDLLISLTDQRMRAVLAPKRENPEPT
jgi:hypothetical protein